MVLFNLAKGSSRVPVWATMRAVSGALGCSSSPNPWYLLLNFFE